MKFLLALVIAVGVLTYPAKIVIQEKEAEAAKLETPHVHQPTDLKTNNLGPIGPPALMSAKEKEVASCLLYTSDAADE